LDINSKHISRSRRIYDNTLESAEQIQQHASVDPMELACGHDASVGGFMVLNNQLSMLVRFGRGSGTALGKT